MQGFNFDAVTFKKDIGVFLYMGIYEYIYEGVVESSHLKKILEKNPPILIKVEK